MIENTEIYSSVDYQKVIIEQLILDGDAYSRAQNILKPEYFDSSLQKAVKFVTEYAQEQREMPSVDLVKAMTGADIAKTGDLLPQSYILEQVEGFCRYRALETVVLGGLDLISTGKGGELEKRVKDALTISLMSDLGTNYFLNPKERLDRLKDKSNIVTTTWKTIDKKLNGGVAKGSLSIWAAQSGGGKSLFLQNMGLSYALMGKTVVYITLELSEDLVNQRIDSMCTGIEAYKVLHNIEETALKVAKARREGNNGQGAGVFMVKKMSEAGTKSNDIRAYLKEFQIKTGLKPDILLVDYLDLMHPNNSKIDVSNLFTKDKYVAEELRSIAGEWDLVCHSASQFNRGSTDAQEFDHSHIAGGISKINTADNVFGIFTTMSMRESGRYQIQFLKTRSAAAVGGKCDLHYDPAILRISDMPEIEDDDIQTSRATSPILTATAPPVQTQRNDVKALLNELRNSGG